MYPATLGRYQQQGVNIGNMVAYQQGWAGRQVLKAADLDPVKEASYKEDRQTQGAVAGESGAAPQAVRGTVFFAG
jgi:hypothetical protein